jgi:light-regulated signal transduction histidine kinase (bacteriophytochrome)
MHEGWRVRKDGTRFWGSVVITALHDGDGTVIGFTKVTRDLTDRKKAEDALKESAILLDQKNKSLEVLNSELSSFVYVASHDMKEPLRKIQTYISMFNEPVSEKGKGYLDRIQGSAARLQNLIEDLLSYSQVSNDVSDTEKLDLNEIVETVKHDLEIGIAHRKAVLTIEKLPEIVGVRFQVYQVFLNLLSNALKFSRPDVSPKVQVRADKVTMNDRSQTPREFYHIEVADNGIGFDAENASRIFEVFQRLHPRQAYAGTGIGLSIVKKVMENHEGMVTAESTPGKGSTFHLYFPVQTE